MIMKTPNQVLQDYEERWVAKWDVSIRKSDFFYLVSCATTDITQPYHSYSYLSAALKRAGVACAVRDLGIEFWHYLISPAVIGELRRACLNGFRKTTGDKRQILKSYAD